MGEAKDSVFRPEFNSAVSVEEAAESLTEDAGALMLREVADKLGVRGLLGSLLDHRVQHLVTHSLEELVLTRVLLMAQGWVDQDDADTLRDDAALRMAVSSRRGGRPVQPARTPLEPEGLPSQPTHSRTQAMLASEHNRRELSRILLETARRRMRAVHGRRRRMVLDVGSLFVAGHLPFPPTVSAEMTAPIFSGGRQILPPLSEADAASPPHLRRLMSGAGLLQQPR